MRTQCTLLFWGRFAAAIILDRPVGDRLFRYNEVVNFWNTSEYCAFKTSEGGLAECCRLKTLIIGAKEDLLRMIAENS